MDEVKMRLSVVLAVFNEEGNLGICLESIKNIADEIVVVDGGSTDRTVEIARSYGAIVVETDNPPIFHINKQKALDKASGAWILQLDADENVNEALAQEIRNTVDTDGINEVDPNSLTQSLLIRHARLLDNDVDQTQNASEGNVAFFVARKNYFLGKFLMHGGAYPDGTIRLVKNGYARYGLKEVHDQMIIEGKVGVLSNDLRHMADPDFSRYLYRSNRYTSMQATEWIENYNGKTDNRTQIVPGIDMISVINWLIVQPTITFLNLFVRHRGFSDGFAGFVWAYYSGLHISSSFIKYWEMRLKN